MQLSTSIGELPGVIFQIHSTISLIISNSLRGESKSKLRSPGGKVDLPPLTFSLVTKWSYVTIYESVGTCLGSLLRNMLLKTAPPRPFLLRRVMAGWLSEMPGSFETHVEKTRKYVNWQIPISAAEVAGPSNE